MSFVKKLSNTELISEKKRLELFPPFLFMGVKVVAVSSDYRTLRVHLPLKWYGKNMHGTMFGGFVAAVADPLPMLLFERIFPGVQTWTRENSVKFLKPIRSGIDLEIGISEETVNEISAKLKSEGQATQEIRFEFRDKRNRLVAQGTNTVFLRKKTKEKS